MDHKNQTTNFDPKVEALMRRIDNDFTYHPPFGDQLDRYKSLRDAAKGFARQIVESSPVSREQALALTHLEQAVMWANAGIARNEKERDATGEVAPT